MKLSGITSVSRDVKSLAFIQDILRVEITGNIGLQLNIIDLPRLISSPNKNQMDNEVVTVYDLADSYITNNRAIIPPVIQASSNPGSQTMIKKSRKFTCTTKS